jgi:hypothetical protein
MDNLPVYQAGKKHTKHAENVIEIQNVKNIIYLVKNADKLPKNI